MKYLPIVGDGGSAGDGVESVSGSMVDNTDPKNPIVNNAPTQFAVLVTNRNTVSTAVTGDPSVFSNAEVNSINPVAPPYAGDFTPAPDGTAALSHDGTIKSYKFTVSGTFNALNPAFFGTYVGIKVIGDIQGEFTGGTKYYPVGVSFGGTQPLGFQISVYGSFPQNEVIRLQISSTVAGNVVLEDCIYTAEKIQP